MRRPPVARTAFVPTANGRWRAQSVRSVRLRPQWRSDPPPPYGDSSVALSALPARSVAAVATRVLPTGAVTTLTATVFFTGLFFGYLLGRRRNNTLPLDNKNVTQNVRQIDFPEEGVTPGWFNYALTKLWALFRKNTRQFAQEAIQPVLDEVDKPEFVRAVRLVKYNIGEEAPQISDLRPVPARSLAEIQCTFQLRFRSTSDLKFEVDVVIPDNLSFDNRATKTLTIPVSLSNLHIDALMWSAFTMAPYEPYCTTWRYSLLETPKVSFDMNVASTLPITEVPGLRSLFFSLIREEIPKDFMFPRSNTVDFTPKKMRAKKEEFMNATIEEIEQMSAEKVREGFPREWALYNSLDLNGNGTLSGDDLASGLENWGYSTADAGDYFERLDPNRSGIVTFPEFCMMWPNVTASEIPEEFEGILSLTVGRASGLTEPTLGWSDPVVELRLGNETVTSALKDDDDDDDDDDDVDVEESPAFDESFDIRCRPPQNETLKVRVLESSKMAFRGRGKVIAEADVPLKSLAANPRQRVDVELRPKGFLNLDFVYAKFVDRWNLCLVENETDDDGETSTKLIDLAKTSVLNESDDGNLDPEGEREQERIDSAEMTLSTIVD